MVTSFAAEACCRSTDLFVIDTRDEQSARAATRMVNHTESPQFALRALAFYGVVYLLAMASTRFFTSSRASGGAMTSASAPHFKDQRTISSGSEIL